MVLGFPVFWLIFQSPFCYFLEKFRRIREVGGIRQQNFFKFL